MILVLLQICIAGVGHPRCPHWDCGVAIIPFSCFIYYVFTPLIHGICAGIYHINHANDPWQEYVLGAHSPLPTPLLSSYLT